MREQENLSFDVSLYRKGLGGLRADLTALTLEHQEAPEEERIVPYTLSFGSNGEPVDFKPRWETEKDFEENRGMYSMRDLALGGESLILWMSPASRKYNYPESRVVVGLVKKADKSGVEIECRGLCLKWDLLECQKLAVRLGETDLDEGGLRSKAIAIKYDGRDWVSQMEELIPNQKIWDQIRGGGDVERMKSREKLMGVVADEFEAEVRLARTRDDFVKVGARIEQRVMAMGINLSARGDCGVLNSALMARRQGAMMGSFEYIFGKSSEAFFDCPKCQGKIPSGKGIETCPHCGAKKSDYGAKCD